MLSSPHSLLSSDCKAHVPATVLLSKQRWSQGFCFERQFTDLALRRDASRGKNKATDGKTSIVHDWEFDVFNQQNECDISFYDYNQDSCCDLIKNNNPTQDHEETKTTIIAELSVCVWIKSVAKHDT